MGTEKKGGYASVCSLTECVTENSTSPWEVVGLVSKCVGKTGGKRVLVLRLKMAFIPL